MAFSTATLIACDSQPSDPLQQARRQLADGQIEASIEGLRSLLAAEPDRADAQMLLGRALLRAGRPSQAIWPLERARRDPEQALPSGFLLASTLFQTQAYADAIRASTQVLEIDASHIGALHVRGQSSMKLKRPADALADAERILEVQPENEAALALKGGALTDLGRADEALLIWTDLRERAAAGPDPDRAARACGALAFFHRTQERLDRAAALYRECLAEYPAHHSLVTWASDFHLQREEPERAIEIGADAIQAEPDDVGLRARQIERLLALERDAAARREIEAAIERFDSPAAWHWLVEFHRRAGSADDALSAIEEALQRDLDASEAMRFTLADLLVETGQIERAETIRDALEEPSYRHLIDGAIAYRAGDPERALDHFESGLLLWPDNAGARYYAGRAALDLGRVDRAVSEFREAVRVGESQTNAALELARIYFTHGDLGSALAFATRQIRSRPFIDVTAHRIAIRASAELGQLESARALAQDLRTAADDDLTWLVELAALERAAGGPEAAAATLFEYEVTASQPGFDVWLIAIADDLARLGRSGEALERVDAALALAPERARLHDLRARLWFAQGQIQEATQASQRALDLDPEDPRALETSAFLARTRGDLRTALARLDAAADFAPDDVRYVYSAAAVARELAEPAVAEARLEEALRRMPGFPQAANDLAWLLAERGEDLDRAARLAALAARRSPSTTTFDTLGWVHHQRGEHQRAIAAYDKALALTPSAPSVQYRTALTRIALDQYPEARALLVESLASPTPPESFPEREQAQQTLAGLDRTEDPGAAH